MHDVNFTHPANSRHAVNSGVAAMEEDGVKVLGSSVSPFSLRVRIALDVKDVPYEYVEEDLVNKSQLLLHSNPVHKKIPVLIHNTKSICESLIILEYIDETWKGGVNLLPKDPYQRALVRFWAAFIDDKLGHSLRGICTCPEGELREKATKETQENISMLEEVFGNAFDGSKGNPFFGGQCIGYLDIVLGVQTMWFQAVEVMSGVKVIDPDVATLLHAWLLHFSSIDRVKKSLSQFEEVLSRGYKIEREYPLHTYP